MDVSSFPCIWQLLRSSSSPVCTLQVPARTLNNAFKAIERRGCSAEGVVTLGRIRAIKGHSCVARGWGECWGLPRASWSAQVGHGRSLLGPLQRSSQLQLPMQLPEARKPPGCLPHWLIMGLQDICALSSAEMPCRVHAVLAPPSRLLGRDTCSPHCASEGR